MCHVISDQSDIGMTDYNDNGEIGAGRRMIEWLSEQRISNVAVFIVRYHSGQNMGPRRFELILEIVEELVNKLAQPNPYSASVVKSQLPKMRFLTKGRYGRIKANRGGSNTPRSRARGLPPSRHITGLNRPGMTTTRNTIDSQLRGNPFGPLLTDGTEYTDSIDAESESDNEVTIHNNFQTNGKLNSPATTM